MKIRLYKGPFSGKVCDWPSGGESEITIRGPKKMSRRAQYEAATRAYKSGAYVGIVKPWRPPTIEARYRICRVPREIPREVLDMAFYDPYPSTPAMTVNTVFMHPDGSLFYEWTGWKREIPW